MKRYTPTVNFRLGQYGNGHVDMREDPTGEWVRYADVPTFRAAAAKLGEETVAGMINARREADLAALVAAAGAAAASAERGE